MTAPALKRYVQGSDEVSGDNLNTFMQTCDTFSQMRAFTGTAGIKIYTAGGNTLGDILEGIFYWNASSTSPDNGDTIIAPTGASTGRWVRLSYGAPSPFPFSDVIAFGAVADGTTDDSGAFQAAQAAGKLTIIPQTGGDYYLASPVSTTVGAWFIDPTLSWEAWSGDGQLDIVRGFWTASSPNGANIWRFADRVFAGDAAAQFAGDQNNLGDSGNSWLSSDTDGPYFCARDAQMLSMATIGTLALSGISRTSDQLDDTRACIGVSGAVLNDKTSTAVPAWALYGDVTRGSSNAFTAGLELAVKNQGDNLTQDPYNLRNSALGLWLAGGGDASYGGAPTNPSDTAITILSNASTWNRGIVFEDDGLTGTDGVTGTGTAISLARGHRLVWYYTPGNEGAIIYSTVDAANSSTTLLFDDGVTLLIGANGHIYFSAAQILNGVNYLNTLGAVAGADPQLRALGDDTNIDLILTPKGTGLVQFGTHVASVETISGYIAVKDAGGTTRHLAVVS